MSTWQRIGSNEEEAYTETCLSEVVWADFQCRCDDRLEFPFRVAWLWRLLAATVR
jgi:hypothetical protein